ncbi:Exopolyphosphatase [Apophysomyces sp. BC1034]|nr:Exopolyphosphatase [Apophysomyces sp. BC1015]KAG0182634.1 Exopolyphosphatase [Apophysomyces sp. BC1021]KAG0192544.1 Exopolyphosphatase [Apophysomyces sp. BC1034]
MANAMNEFLDNVKLILQKKPDAVRTVIVTGNDSADLDSIVCALLFAFLSSQLDQSKCYLPLIKVPFADLALRPEVEFVLSQANIATSKLICIDHVDLDALKEEGAQIVLVDHNRLTAPFDDSWNDRVIGVLDHHVDERQYQDVPLRTISMVGSCTSLVVLHFAETIQHYTWLVDMIIAPILVDTIGLREEYGKTTETDVRAFELLKSCNFQKTSNVYYEEIEKVKSRVEHLSSRDLLRKDYKEWVVNGFRVGTSSVSWHLQAWEARNGIQEIIQPTWDFIDERQLDLEIILTSYDHSKEGGKYERELAFFVANERLLEVKSALEEMQDVGLTSIPFTFDIQNGRVGFYNQGNVRMSRKQIWPLVQSLLEKIVK